MNLRILRCAASAMTIGLILASTVDVTRAEKPTKTVTGIVRGYDSYKGKVTSITIKDAEQGEFLVLRGSEKGKELLRQVGATVKATGYLQKSNRDPEHTVVLDVIEFEVLTPPAGTPGSA